MAGPRIYLAIDNCFASKRWTRPAEWAAVVRDLGLTCVEASADNECDALYSTAAYRDQWADQVRDAYQRTGVRVVNLYSGHGTYATLGLGHTDRGVRDHMLNDWAKVMVETAGRLDAGLGFFCHAFDLATLEDPAAYESAERDLYDRLAEVAAHAARCGARTVGVEQMYTPHQIPWTLDGADTLMREVLARSGQPFYLTIDTGHQIGQRRFLRPQRSDLIDAVRRTQGRRVPDGLWLGSRRAYDLFREAAAAPTGDHDALLARVEAEMDRCPYLFASYEDGDPYAWLERFACYSPIIHLQQTDGTSSSHWPFTEAYNRAGVIHGDRLLGAIATAYARDVDPGLPPRCEDLYLTIEVFSGTADLPVDIISRLEDTVAYWRRYVPSDGLTLDALLKPGGICGA